VYSVTHYIIVIAYLLQVLLLQISLRP